jgi:[methyl-Co(III) methanol-specific corrinoid protein]:coenzyme M methyltransferase
MMNAAIVDVMNKTGHTLPDAHHDDKLMAELSHDVYENTGFENFGIPFCMTVEAEVLAAALILDHLNVSLRLRRKYFLQHHRLNTGISMRSLKTADRDGIQAGYHLSKKYSDVPVIGNLTGPISTAASIVDPMSFLKELRKDRENAHKVIDYVTDFLIEYAKLMIDNGVDLIS